MICLTVALRAEAKPLIDYYELKPYSPKGLFRVFKNEEIALVISGIGKIAAAAATTFLYTVLGQYPHRGWLNIGVAGHAERAIGEGVLAHRIMDMATEKTWHSQPIVEHIIPTDRLITVDTPEINYRDSAMYDMEASGFYAIACRFTQLELVQCYKVISDNLATPTSTIVPRRVEQLIVAKLDEIDGLIAKLRSRSGLKLG